jgi:cyclophilin family peptidyl-prolyl cis-trans isomerase
MIQGGDPLGNGQGGPGYSFKDEFVPQYQFTGPGILAMANAGPATNGSQFFITHVTTPWLNNRHTIFGFVVTGQDVVDAVQQGDYIVKVKIIRKGKKAKKFNAAKVFEELRAK